MCKFVYVARSESGLIKIGMSGNPKRRMQSLRLATGEQHTVREFAETAFGYLGLDYKEFVKVDSQFLRPADVETLLGDPSKARTELGWSYHSTFADLVHEMVEADLQWFKSRHSLASS